MKKGFSACLIMMLSVMLASGSPAQAFAAQQGAAGTEAVTGNIENEAKASGSGTDISQKDENETAQTEAPQTETPQTGSETPQTETPQTETETPSGNKTVSVKGLKRKISKAVSSKAVIKDVIKISPVHSCKVKLQYYSSDKKKWVSESTFTVKKNGNGKVTLKYSSKWKKTRKSKWRVYIPASDGYKKYVSGSVTITSSRPKNAKIGLSSKSAVIIRASDGYVIYGKKKNKKLPNASTTKMMTALLTIEKGGLDSVTSISAKAANTGWGCLGASAGTKFRVRDLLNVMLIHSSNDAASALAEYNAGSIKKFASKMNKRAKKLGCKNTHFVNPHGLNNSKHYSTAYDLALIQRECIKHKTYRDIVKKSKYSFSTVSKPKTNYTFYTTDALLGSRKGFQGGKTGYTEQAGSCFCGIYKYNGVTYIFTVLGNSTSSGRWNDCRKLMNFIKKNYK